MEQYQYNKDEMEIDLREILGALLDKIGVIILSGIAVALAAVIATMLFMTPQYESTTKMYVLSKQDNSMLTNSDLQTSTLLTKDYIEMIQSRTVTEGVIAKLDLDMTHEQLLGKMSVSAPTDTRVIAIKIKDADPYRAAKIANAVRDEAAEHIQQVMDIEAVNVVDEANIPASPVSPSVKKNGVLGGLLGVFAAAAVIIVIFIMNDTIKTEGDIERYLNISTLGTIPLVDNEKKSKKYKGKGRR